MSRLSDLRASKPAPYPAQAVYAEYAARNFGLAFEDVEGGSGLAFIVSSRSARVAFGGGRCSYFPQNNAAAATLAADKYLSNVVLGHAGIATLGGRYFFLSDRHRAHRPAGHDRDDAMACFATLGSRAFLKPLTGSRGDYAQAIHDAGVLAAYLDEVSRHYDAVIMQPIVHGTEYRVVMLDGEPVYWARKHQPFLTGDGVTPLRDLAAARNASLHAQGVSTASTSARDDPGRVPHSGERIDIAGRANLSAGGAMAFEAPQREQDALAMARAAMRALGLRAAGVDLFTDIDGDPAAMKIIELNANPAIRFLEDGGRDDLILTIWRHTFTATGLIGV